MQRYLAVVIEIAVKVPLQKASVSQSVTRQNAVILTPILFAVHTLLLISGQSRASIRWGHEKSQRHSGKS